MQAELNEEWETRAKLEKQVEELRGEALYPTRDTIIHGLHKDSKEDVDRMVQDLEKQ
ncbi:hypothetical protein IscW_ISCW003252 [Ixodes scapularis]|uniref:Pre-mRNA-splicing factor SYF2 n=1 Tax=Ixodes scapularis TaxID=6945 RepID=B7PAE9_IXOSC|nr:hypothetical protein IscW_ISCW003252 [Ixodes scapularis]|eukprot:XP_002406817.1 hypothetical protein IscW_ISCW003252 [Ixodes scapularis]